MIPTPEINQFNRGGSGHCSSLVGLSIQLVVALYSLSVKGLWLILVVSHIVLEKSIPIPSQVGRLIQVKPGCTVSCQGSIVFIVLCIYTQCNISIYYPTHILCALFWGGGGGFLFPDSVNRP